MKELKGNKLCILLKNSNLREDSKLSYMHNLETRFVKILIYANLQWLICYYQIVALSIISETLGIDSENLLFSKLRTEYQGDFPNLIDRSNSHALAF